MDPELLKPNMYLEIAFDLLRMAEDTDKFRALPLRLIGSEVEPITSQFCHTKEARRRCDVWGTF